MRRLNCSTHARAASDTPILEQQSVTMGTHIIHCASEEVRGTVRGSVALACGSRRHHTNVTAPPRGAVGLPAAKSGGAVIPEVHPAVTVLASVCSGRHDERCSRMPGGESLAHGPAAIVDRRALDDYHQGMAASVMLPKKSTMSSSTADESSPPLRSAPDSRLDSRV
jgi:hypothetical protein